MQKSMRIKGGKAKQDLINGPVGKTLISFSTPFILSTFLQTLYSTVDTVVVGQYLGSEGLSAVTNGSQLMQFLSMFCIGFASAGEVLVSQSVGVGNKKKVQGIASTLSYLMVTISIVLGIVTILLCDVFLTVLNTPAEAYVQARYYVLICGAGILFTGLYNMFSAVLRGMGDSRHPLIFVLIASVVNLVLDVIFIAVFHWSVAGAALATVIGQAVSVVFSYVYLLRHQELFEFSVRLRDLKYDRALSGQIFKMGIPLALQSAAVHMSFLFVAKMINSLGVTASAAFGVSQKLRSIPEILTQGLRLGASNMMGQNLGAGKTKRVSSTVHWSLLIAIVIYAFFGILFGLLPELSFRMFTQDESVLLYAGICVFALLAELPGRCLMPGCNGLISAQGFVKLSITLALVDAFVGRIFFCWLLGVFFGLGLKGFLLGYAMGTYLTAVPGFVYYISGMWKKRKLLV